MDLDTAFQLRRTIREFENRPIYDEILKKILNHGYLAPSNSHMRTWQFIIVDDLSIREEIVGSKCENLVKERDEKDIFQKYPYSDPEQRAMYKYAVPKQAIMILSAARVIVPLYRNPYDLSHPRKPSHFNYLVSMWMCIENILLSAVEEGIYGVTYIHENSSQLKNILQIPDEMEPACILALGYPSKNARKFLPDPVKIEDRMHINIFGKK